jgi:hypothetical protein
MMIGPGPGGGGPGGGGPGCIGSMPRGGLWEPNAVASWNRRFNSSDRAVQPFW